MDVVLLYFDDCPNWQTMDDRLREVAAAEAVSIRRQAVATAEEAAATGMRGSPTLLIDGRDPFVGAIEAPPSLSCRLYETPEGMAGSPTVAQLRSALRATGPGGDSA